MSSERDFTLLHFLCMCNGFLKAHILYKGTLEVIGQRELDKKQKGETENSSYFYYFSIATQIIAKQVRQKLLRVIVVTC